LRTFLKEWGRKKPVGVSVKQLKGRGGVNRAVEGG